MLAWFVVAAILGIAMIKKTAGTLSPMAQQMKNGVIPNPMNQPPESTIAKSIATGIAGFLFFLPGLLSDVLALLLLLPFVQKKLVDKAKNYAMNNQEKMMAMMARQMGGTGTPFGGQNPFGGSSPFGSTGSRYSQGQTIDGTAKITSSMKVDKPANDE